MLKERVVIRSSFAPAPRSSECALQKRACLVIVEAGGGRQRVCRPRPPPRAHVGSGATMDMFTPVMASTLCDVATAVVRHERSTPSRCAQCSIAAFAVASSQQRGIGWLAAERRHVREKRAERCASVPSARPTTNR